MKNKMGDVQNLLIESMEKLVNPEEGDEFGVDEANAVADLGKVIVESAKAEVAFVKAVGATEGSGFFQVKRDSAPTTLQLGANKNPKED